MKKADSHLLAFCGMKALEYSDETKVNIWTGNKKIKEFVAEIFPQAKPSAVLDGSECTLFENN